MDINELCELSLNYDEYAKLRNEKNVILNPIGTLPKYSQQNNDFGLPIAIMDYQFNVVDKYRKDTGIINDINLINCDNSEISNDLEKERRENKERIEIDQILHSNNFIEFINIYKVVYEDLTLNHGYFIKQGSKYGCDFLVYEEDPSKCHSFAMIQVLGNNDSNNSKLDMQELILWIRVANKVNKMLIVAIVLNNNEVKYIHIDNYTNNLKVIK
ncbi:tRNA intron endonuclease [Cryptosporidium bovis]|uniref:tRNA intron endonuclease n=1 Tax=Cryptosporidium bovis TaxID=310047 RepID=UPI00351A5539|nr:tRNA intron endonuclease [Cryptosporidium bovis]